MSPGSYSLWVLHLPQWPTVRRAERRARDRRVEHDAGVLRGALRTRARGVNILLYGDPGTGKTKDSPVLSRRVWMRGPTR